MIYQQVTLSGDAEWPKVADAVIEAHFRPASSLDGEVMLVKFFHARDCLPYDKTRGTLHARPGARGPQVFRY